jgi:hypothetical protein
MTEETKLQLRALFKRIVILCLILALITLLLFQWKERGMHEGKWPGALLVADLLIALSGAMWYALKSGIGGPWLFVRVLIGIASAAVATGTLAAMLFVAALVPGSLPDGGSGGGHHSHFD